MTRTLLAEEVHEFFSFPDSMSQRWRSAFIFASARLLRFLMRTGIHGAFLTDCATQPLHPERRGSMHLLSECFT